MSGRLVGSISTYPGTYKCPWSRIISKNPPRGNLFTEYGRDNRGLVSPLNGLVEIYKNVLRFFLKMSVSKNYDFSTELRVLEGWKSCGRPVGFVSATPGDYRSSWCRVIIFY